MVDASCTKCGSHLVVDDTTFKDFAAKQACDFNGLTRWRVVRIVARGPIEQATGCEIHLDWDSFFGANPSDASETYQCTCRSFDEWLGIIVSRIAQSAVRQSSPRAHVVKQIKNQLSHRNQVFSSKFMSPKRVHVRCERILAHHQGFDEFILARSQITQPYSMWTTQLSSTMPSVAILIIATESRSHLYAPILRFGPPSRPKGNICAPWVRMSSRQSLCRKWSS